MSFEFKMHIGENNYLHCNNLTSDELKKEINYHKNEDTLDIDKYMLKNKNTIKKCSILVLPHLPKNK